MAVIRALTLTAGLVATLTLTPSAATATDCTWDQVGLAVTGRTTDSSIHAAANGGWFAGDTDATGATRWHGHSPTYLGWAFGRQTMLSDVNSSGVTVGTTIVNSFEDGAVVYRGSRFESLPTLQGMRMPRAFAINDAGDIVGTANRLADMFNATLWPAASPGAVVEINPDPAVYSYVSPVDIDEQGRILLKADGVNGMDFFLRYPDGTMTKLSLPAVQYVDAFRNGRILGQHAKDGKLTTAEWDLSGQLVREYPFFIREAAIDSGSRVVGTHLTADRTYVLGLWENGELVHTFATSANGDLGWPSITDDGVVATSLTNPATGRSVATAWRATCS
jgi:hypothetical protein